MTEFGKVLRIIRINSGDSAKLMAQKLGISVPYLNAIENGRRDVPNDMPEKVISVYGLSERDRGNLNEALVATKDRLKIDLTELSEKRRKAIFALANEDFDAKTLDEICNLINSNGGDRQ